MLRWADVGRVFLECRSCAGSVEVGLEVEGRTLRFRAVQPSTFDRLTSQKTYLSKRYPTFHTVMMCLGFAASCSIFRRSSATCESTVRVVTNAL